MELDPPPDIVLEVDNTTDSRRKFVIYAALGIPELWRLSKQGIEICELREGRYEMIPESRFLPGLSGQMITDHIENSKTLGQTKALKLFRERISRSM